MIRLTVPSIDDAEIAAVSAVLRSGYLVQGPRVKAFEDAVAERVGVSHAVAVSSGTAALHLALLSLGVGPDDLVLTTAYSWPATANVVELCGARPIFVDISPDTFNIAPVHLKETCRQLYQNASTAERVKAILPVHAFGQPADMTAIMRIAGEYALPVVEDAACALGAAWDGQPVGSMGRLGCFSFHPRKAITTGEGGMITTNDDALANRLRALRNHGLDANSPEPDFVLPGFNYRMTEISAALGPAQLGKLGQLIAMRRAKAETYDREFANSDIQPPVQATEADSVYQSYTVQIPDRGSMFHQSFVSEMRRQGVEVTIGTYHIPMTRYYCDRYEHRAGAFPATDSVSRRAVTLPLHQLLGASDQQRIVDLAKKCSSDGQASSLTAIDGGKLD